MTITIRLARPNDIAALATVERSAAEAFRVLPDHVSGNRTVPTETLLDMIHNNLLWVAVNKQDTPVGFVGCTTMQELLYIHEISVALPQQKQGIGRRLMETVLDYAMPKNYSAIGLTTQRDLVWNKPFYTTLGFTELTDMQSYPALSQKLQSEIVHGANPLTRCAMVKYLNDID